MEISSTEFMCSCDEDGKKKCKETRELARKIVEKSTPCKDDIDFVDRLLYFLSGDGGVRIGSDMWAVVIVDPIEPHQDDNPIKEQVRIQCDSIVDGLAAAVVYYYQDK